MAVLTRNAISLNGNVNIGAALANGVAVSSSDTVTNVDGRTMLFINNAGGSTDTVTIPVQNSNQFTAAGVPVTPSNISIAILTTETRIIGPVSPSVYNDANGMITIQHSFTTSVKIYAFSLPITF